MARLKNVSGADLMLFARPGQGEGFNVPAGAIVDIPGEVDELATSRGFGDSVVIGGRAWPKAQWSVTAEEDRNDGGTTVDEPRSTKRGKAATEEG